MKKIFAAIAAFVMMLLLNVTAFAAGGELTVDQAKQAALDFAGVKEADACFTRAFKSWDDGRELFEVEFYADNTEYDVDVDARTGRITDFSTEFHGRGNQTVISSYHARYDALDDIFDFNDDDVFDWD